MSYTTNGADERRALLPKNRAVVQDAASPLSGNTTLAESAIDTPQETAHRPFGALFFSLFVDSVPGTYQSRLPRTWTDNFILSHPVVCPAKFHTNRFHPGCRAFGPKRIVGRGILSNVRDGHWLVSPSPPLARTIPRVLLITQVGVLRWEGRPP